MTDIDFLADAHLVFWPPLVRSAGTTGEPLELSLRPMVRYHLPQPTNPDYRADLNFDAWVSNVRHQLEKARADGPGRLILMARLLAWVRGLVVDTPGGVILSVPGDQPVPEDLAWLLHPRRPLGSEFVMGAADLGVGLRGKGYEPPTVTDLEPDDPRIPPDLRPTFVLSGPLVSIEENEGDVLIRLAKGPGFPTDFKATLGPWVGDPVNVAIARTDSDEDPERAYVDAVEGFFARGTPLAHVPAIKPDSPGDSFTTVPANREAPVFPAQENDDYRDTWPMTVEVTCSSCGVRRTYGLTPDDVTPWPTDRGHVNVKDSDVELHLLNQVAEAAAEYEAVWGKQPCTMLKEWAPVRMALEELVKFRASTRLTAPNDRIDTCQVCNAQVKSAHDAEVMAEHLAIGGSFTRGSGYARPCPGTGRPLPDTHSRDTKTETAGTEPPRLPCTAVGHMVPGMACELIGPNERGAMYVGPRGWSPDEPQPLAEPAVATDLSLLCPACQAPLSEHDCPGERL